MYLTYLSKARQDNENELLVFPVSCILQNGSPRYFASTETARSISIYWADVSLPQPKKLTIGDAFEVDIKSGFSTYSFDESNVKPIYEIPALDEVFQQHLVEALDAAFLTDAEQNYDDNSLEKLASHIIEKINGTPAMEMFRTSDVMQTLKRSRNSFARALSLTQAPKESCRLFSLLLNDTDFTQGRELISAAIRSLQCIPTPMIKSILKNNERNSMIVDRTIRNIQRKQPLRAFSISNKLSPDSVSDLQDSIKHLRNGLKEGVLNSNQATNLLRSQFPALKNINPVELSDILHQTWNKNMQHQVDVLKDLLSALINVPQSKMNGVADLREPQAPAVVPGRPSLRPTM